MQALGGAKNHGIIMPDAIMDQVCDSVMGAAYGSAGERCMAISVAVAVGEKTAEEFVSKMTERIKKLKVGHFSDSNSEMGPVITKQSQEKIISHITQSEKDGAKVICDGRGFKVEGYENGYWVGPTLIDNVTDRMDIYKEEIFGTCFMCSSC